MDAFVKKPLVPAELLAVMEGVVPEGHGQPNEAPSSSVAGGADALLAPVSSVVDIETGLRAWMGPEKYAEALTRFVTEYGDAADRIEAMLQGGWDEKARVIAHTLKGLSLGLTAVSAASTEIDESLKKGDRETAKVALPRLAAALREAASAIGRLDLPESSEKPKMDFDPEVVGQLLRELSHALTTDNPDPANAVLARLGDYLAASQLAPVREPVEDFDFRRGESETKKLAGSLGIKMEES